MGFLWDLYQQNQLANHADHARSVEQRVIELEAEVTRLRGVVSELISRLETRLDADLDNNGRVG